MSQFLNETYQGLKSYDEARIVKKMLLSKNMDSANEIETAYDMFGRPCTQEEASSMTFKPLTCPDGQVGNGDVGYCYSRCVNNSYKSPGFGLAFKNDDEVINFLQTILSGERTQQAFLQALVN